MVFALKLNKNNIFFFGWIYCLVNQMRHLKRFKSLQRIIYLHFTKNKCLMRKK